MKTNILRKIGLGSVIPIVVLVAWYLVTTYGSIPIGILPPIHQVGSSFKNMIESGQLKEDLLISLSRVVKGYFVSVVLGVSIGSLMGMFTPMQELFLPVITVVRQIPMIAWIPLVILWCGIGELSKVVIIVLAAFFPILVNTQSGMENTPAGYIEVAKLYKLSKWKTFIKVYLPHAIPHILVGLRLGLGVSWMAVVASELIAAVSGIGYRMSDARSMMQPDVVIVCMIVIGFVGVLMDKVIGLIFEWLTPWTKEDTK